MTEDMKLAKIVKELASLPLETKVNLHKKKYKARSAWEMKISLWNMISPAVPEHEGIQIISSDEENDILMSISDSEYTIFRRSIMKNYTWIEDVRMVNESGSRIAIIEKDHIADCAEELLKANSTLSSEILDQILRRITDVAEICSLANTTITRLQNLARNREWWIKNKALLTSK